MNKEKALLKMMIKKEVDKLGDIRYHALRFSFYDFIEKLNLNKEDYENLLKEMRHKGYIEIYLNGWETFSRAAIKATKYGAEFLDDGSDGNQIGF